MTDNNGSGSVYKQETTTDYVTGGVVHDSNSTGGTGGTGGGAGGSDKETGGKGDSGKGTGGTGGDTGGTGGTGGGAGGSDKETGGKGDSGKGTGGSGGDTGGTGGSGGDTGGTGGTGGDTGGTGGTGGDTGGTGGTGGDTGGTGGTGGGTGGSGKGTGGTGNGPVDGTDENDVMLPLFVDTDGDTIDGDDGDDDIIFAYKGDDIVGAGKGNDTVFGGEGDDTLDGGEGEDTLYGGADRDLFLAGDATDNIGDLIEGGSDGDDFDTLDLTGAGPLRIVGETTDSDGDSTSGTVEFLDAPGGSVIGSLEFNEIENVIVCFTRGTMIVTENGEKAIEQLSVGDMVLTKDNGLRELRWIGSRTVAAQDNLAPIMIKAGAMANDRDLLVSPQHRMVVEGWKSELLFGEREVLAAAKHLVNNDTIYVQEGGMVAYFHMLFDTHEIVFANGAASESFHPGEVGMSALTDAACDEIYALFPELRDNAASYGPAARTSLKGHEAKVLAQNPDFLS